MPDRNVDFLLIGGGMASAQCAAELRKRGAEGSITLVGREPDPPYERPPLSKEYLRGKSERHEAHAHEKGWYEENDVELITGRSVMSLDVSSRVAKLQGKEEIGFDKALIATGAMVNILRVEGAGQLQNRGDTPCLHLREVDPDGGVFRRRRLLGAGRRVLFSRAAAKRQQRDDTR